MELFVSGYHFNVISIGQLQFFSVVRMDESFVGRTDVGNFFLECGSSAAGKQPLHWNEHETVSVFRSILTTVLQYSLDGFAGKTGKNVVGNVATEFGHFIF